MRVSGDGERAVERRGEGRRADFGAALRKAEARRGEGGRAETGRAAARLEERRGARGAEGQGGPAEGRGAIRPPVALPAGAAPAGGPGVQAEAVPGGPAVAAPGSAPAGAPSAAGQPARSALVEAVRALPPVIESFGASGRELLALDFGGAIGVELRRAPGGVEVGLSVPMALRPVARAELAGICRALAARGVTVASAEVRGGMPGRGRRR